MYIALKWLVSFATVMWVTLCICDLSLKSQNIHRKPAEHSELKNASRSHLHQKTHKTNYFYFGKDVVIDTMPVLHYIMFFAGATLVTVLRKNESFLVTYKNIFANTYRKFNNSATNIYVKKVLSMSRNALVKHTKQLWSKLKFYRCISLIRLTKNSQQSDTMLLQKITRVIDERKKLNQLLDVAIIENYNIRLLYQKETMAKNRLEKYIEDTQKQIKEHRSKYISCQNLYLVTHQENLFLKACIRKISDEKEKAEKKFMSLLKHMYQSKNTELRAFCANFLVKSNKSLLNSNTNDEIQKYINSRYPRASTSRELETEKTLDLGFGLVPSRSDGPKLRGLPGEYVWTVKDKDGMIEKLYEYQCDDVDNGDTIRRIRQYSVYWDKDCLVDFSPSRSLLSGSEISSVDMKILSANQKFLTGSEEFKKFLRNNKSIISRSTSQPSVDSL